ncbi:MAG: N-6 DNA methylase, partial [Nostocaceae cyanobacterium]|nr:N-6 DNA methylase [Nostocaceae cyanobacterium]
MVLLKSNQAIAFGDFQTPDDLANLVVQVVQKLCIQPKSILEPTCGHGSLLLAAVKSFPQTQQFIGVEINQAYLEELHRRLITHGIETPVETLKADFFKVDWSEILSKLPEPILVIGNPPWVTNATLGGLCSPNLPKKSNFQRLSGLDALTGKSNFDISEWMLLQHLEWFKERDGVIAMLCKASVARKVLAYAWKHNYPISIAQIYKFDAMKYFKASVDACLFIVKFEQHLQSQDCLVYDNLS